ncbi:hypothetical protein BC834DRAFT_975584 [Gloeopeniophorella convolvens]|nr:hypothetical protein BC834DRAFT_975584 [Gloeopeniophorella convolvens]
MAGLGSGNQQQSEKMHSRMSTSTFGGWEHQPLDQPSSVKESIDYSAIPLVSSVPHSTVTVPPASSSPASKVPAGPLPTSPQVVEDGASDLQEGSESPSLADAMVKTIRNLRVAPEDQAFMVVGPRGFRVGTLDVRALRRDGTFTFAIHIP